MKNSSSEPDDAPYFVYLLECADGTFYAGITTDLARRLLEHNGSGKGARYTRSRRPVMLRYAEPSRSRSAAQRREYDIRRMTRARKLKLIEAVNASGLTEAPRR